MEALPELIAGYGRMYPFNKVNEKWIQNNFNVKIPEKTWHFFYKFDDIILMGSENGFFVGVVSDIDTLYNNYTYYFVEDPKNPVDPNNTKNNIDEIHEWENFAEISIELKNKLKNSGIKLDKPYLFPIEQFEGGWFNSMCTIL